MKKITYIISVCVIAMAFNSCGVLLNVPVVTKKVPLESYQFAVVPATSTINSTKSSAYDYSYVYTKSTNPSEIITGYLIKRGYTILPSVTPECASRTLIFNYSQTGKRSVGLFSYTMEVTIQVLSAEDYSLVAQTTAEGIGDTEADDCRQAITNALNALFGVQ